jgi:hypothetical protein
MRAGVLLFVMSCGLAGCAGQSGFASDGGSTDSTFSRDVGAPGEGSVIRAVGDASVDRLVHMDSGRLHDSASADVVSDGAAESQAACGVPDAGCCPGESCNDGGCCVDQLCVASGGTCADGLGACHAGSCGSCGGVKEPCCMEVMSDTCSGVSANCPGCTASGTTCVTGSAGTTGTCEACGTEGIRCCGGDQTCLGVFALCAAGLCTSHCGKAGDTCCQGETCQDGGCCLSSSTGATCSVSPTCGCTAGACTTCGRQGLPGECLADDDGGFTCHMPAGP